MEEEYNPTNNDEALGARSSDREATHDILREYTVEERDTLADIARKHGVSWDEIKRANQDVLNDTDHLAPGWKLKIPNSR